MELLIIGSGGREHAFGWKLAQHGHHVSFAPGNAGTAQVGTNVTIDASDTPRLIDFARRADTHLIIVGPDDLLAAGIVDEFQAAGLRIYGPTRAAAQIEASKAFARQVMSTMGISHATGQSFTDYAEAERFLRTWNGCCVVKADGLALGKGSYPCRTLAEAQLALKRIMIDRVHRDAGMKVVIEEFLDGVEVSGHAICSGTDFVWFPFAMDHKRALDGDRGDNTGGMGTVAPIAGMENQFATHMEMLDLTLHGLQLDKRPFTGTLFPGYMSTNDGLKVLEFNARFGDPETQSYMRLLESDLLEILDAAVDGNLQEVYPDVRWKPASTACVVMASGGYPGEYKKGVPITGIEDAEKVPGVVVFHAGTKLNDAGKLVTNGGRVLGVSAYADDLQTALDRAYEAVSRIHFDGMHFRRDIGKKALELERAEKAEVANRPD